MQYLNINKGDFLIKIKVNQTFGKCLLYAGLEADFDRWRKKGLWGFLMREFSDEKGEDYGITGFTSSDKYGRETFYMGIKFPKNEFFEVLFQKKISVSISIDENNNISEEDEKDIFFPGDIPLRWLYKDQP